MLPVTMTFEDFNNTEKIAYPKTPFTLEGTKKGAAPAEGDILVYAPWGNLSIFIMNITIQMIFWQLDISMKDLIS